MPNHRVAGRNGPSPPDDETGMPSFANPSRTLPTLTAVFVAAWCIAFAVGVGLDAGRALAAAVAVAVASLSVMAILVRQQISAQRESRLLFNHIRTHSLVDSPLPAADGQLSPVVEALEQQLLPLRAELGAAIRVAGRMRSIFEQSDDVIFIVDANTLKVVDSNPCACRLLGRDWSQLCGQPMAGLLLSPEWIAGWHPSAVWDGPRQMPSHRVGFHGAGGVALHLDITLSRINADGRRLLLLMGRDTRERDEAQNRIRHLAYHDTLTDLPNRTLLGDRVDNAIKRARRNQQIGALLFLDLDNFKRINDSLGHTVGDLLLRELARRLRAGLREEDTVSRLGGDEFVVLIEHLGTDPERAERQVHEIAEKVRGILDEAFDLHGHELHVTGSIGYVTFPRDGETMEILLRHADLAMYQAKKAGRNNVTRFEHAMDEHAAHRLRIESEIRAAMRDGHLQLYFQPVQRIRDGRLQGAEALLRWIHPQDGVITPEHFLPQLEDSALMLHLADWVLREACRCQAQIAHDRELFTPDYIAVNISHQQFHQPDFIERVEYLVGETGADPNRLLFEITETVIMHNTVDASARMLALKQLGFRFAIDDFGTGYSSLSYLKQLPADTLKIDKGFVRNLASDPDDAAIVRTILGIADQMGMGVIAEGVETYDQLDFLRSNDCACYQGYLARPPLPLADFHEELRHSQFLRVVQ